jgi:rhodanese-related sulfurtransferase
VTAFLPRIRRHYVDILLVAAALVTAWRAGAAWRESPPAGVPAIRLEVGSELQLPGVKWTAGTSVVIAIQTSCPGCNSSVLFYRRLSDHLRVAGIPLFVVGREPAPVVSAWLRVKAISPAEIALVPTLATIGVVVTPTMVVVDGAGVVTDIVSGKVTEEEEAQLYERLRGGVDRLSRLTYARLIHERDLGKILALGPVMLDIRERSVFASGHRAGAINIPHDEVAARGLVELSLIRPVLIDCREAKFMRCEIAGEALIRLGAESVAIVIPDSVTK